MKDKVCLITGANGFLGSALVSCLKERNLLVRESVRDLKHSRESVGDVFVSGTINQDTIWSEALTNVDVVIHTAALVHSRLDFNEEKILEYNNVNKLGTINLAKQAASAGVKKFIFISSIKVNGETTTLGTPFTAYDIANPLDPYAKSKYDAEVLLLDIGMKTGMDIVIIRPPLIYGPNVKANFASLLNLVSKGLPLPFGCLKYNKRSFVSLGNLVSLIVTCLEHPKAANEIFLVSDDYDLSTADLIYKLGNALGKSTLMLPLPILFFNVLAKLFRKQDVIERLTGCLHVDISKTKKILDWHPPQSVDEGFKQVADAFLERKNK